MKYELHDAHVAAYYFHGGWYKFRIYPGLKVLNERESIIRMSCF